MSTGIGEGYRGEQGRMSYLLRQLCFALDRRVERVLAPHGLTLPDYLILSVLHLEPDLDESRLAGACQTHPGMLRSQLVNLVRDGLLQHPRDASGRVQRHCHLTERGQQVLARVDPLVREAESELVHGLGGDRQLALRRWLAAAARRVTED
ncbi:MAG: hypothetical protein PVJ40_06140 [Gammaproteobacteria bacterium]|jgi:DNA-binding MarR family transcriptional regulator